MMNVMQPQFERFNLSAAIPENEQQREPLAQ